MATLSNILLDKEILLESGTNELEVLVFTVADYTFGINVAKVREVLPWQEITNLPQAHPSICGVFKLRERVIPCVSLARHLGISSAREDAVSTVILTDLNKQQTAFVVDSVDRIYRLSWENILAMPGLNAFSHTPVTALARHDDRLIVMLDFEMMLSDLTSHLLSVEAIENPMELPRDTYKILFAEDSPTVREAIGQTLRKSGYEQIRFFENGAEAWQWIETAYAQNGQLQDVGDILISDVEMPRIDGFHLTKRIKQHPGLAKMPVLLYSSIVTPDNVKKGKMVGADAQVSKPELGRVVELVDELLSGRRQTCSIEDTAVVDAVRETPVAGESTKTAPVATVQNATQKIAEQPRQNTQECEEQAQTRETECSRNEESFSSQVADEPAAKTPEGVDPSLWNSFRRELHDHIVHLGELLECLENGDKDGELTRDVLRTLHTIKSASMVVPLDPVSRCTHMAEDLAEAARNNPQLWKSEAMYEFMSWLEGLTNPSADVEAMLDSTDELETLLAANAV